MRLCDVTITYRHTLADDTYRRFTRDQGGVKLYSQFIERTSKITPCMKTLKKDINKSVYNMCVIKSIGRNAFNGGVIIIFLIIIISFYLFLLR